MNAVKHYTNDKVRDMLEDFRKSHLYPSYAVLAKEIGITYTYLLEFKNGTREMGQDGLQRVVSFIEEQER